ncbi:MAG: hypothetical protein ACFFBD_08515, partial [Candidatus Hodarchaeota archaeon]
MKRFTTFDFIRGIGIICVIIFHRIVWDYYYSTSGLDPTSEINMSLLGILFLFLSMAGIFYVISGSVNAYVTYHRASSKKTNAAQTIFSGWITGIVFIIISYLFRIFLFRAIKEWTGLIPYFVLYGEIRSLKLTVALVSGTIWIIGSVVILVSTILGLFLHFERIKDVKKIYSTFSLIGVIILVLTLPLTALVGPSVEQAIWSENW